MTICISLSVSQAARRTRAIRQARVDLRSMYGKPNTTRVLPITAFSVQRIADYGVQRAAYRVQRTDL